MLLERALSDEQILFHRPWRSAQEDTYVGEALRQERRQGAGTYTKACHDALSAALGAPVLLTQSCTAAMEFAGLLLDLKQDDEVIVPSFTFSSTATAFAIHGAKVVFVDCDPRTQNIDPAAIEGAVTERTRAIVAMHYGGVACDMPVIEAIARRYNLSIVEDAAQAIGARASDGRALGAIGDLGALSFHDTKNVSSGEGGALIMGNHAFLRRAEVMWEKGTDRSRYLRGEVDKYSWVDIGSSFLPSEITAALLKAQLEETALINEMRLAIWNRYNEAFAGLEQQGRLVRPYIPVGATHNAHLYYIITENADQRQALIAHLKQRGIHATFHYVPLHNSVAGERFGRTVGEMTNTIRAGDQLLRLPLWPGMSPGDTERVIEATHAFYGS